jgi:hypothetical protein
LRRPHLRTLLLLVVLLLAFLRFWCATHPDRLEREREGDVAPIIVPLPEDAGFPGHPPPPPPPPPDAGESLAP